MDFFRREPQPHFTGTVVSISEPNAGGNEKLVVLDLEGKNYTYALPADSPIKLEKGKPYGITTIGRHPQPPIIATAILSPEQDIAAGGADSLASQIEAGRS